MEDRMDQAQLQRLAELTAEAQHARERYRLYRAKLHGPRLTSPGRLRELERASAMADAMLRRARPAAKG